MKEFLYFILAVVLVTMYIGWRNNPNRRWKIDANIRTVVNAPPGTMMYLENIPEDLFREYKHQTRGYKDIRCGWVQRTGCMCLRKVEEES